MVFSQVFLLLLGLLFLFPLLFAYLHPNHHLTNWTLWVRDEGQTEHKKGQGGPHLLHALQVDAIMGLAVVSILGLVILVVALVVRVDVALVVGNGGHRFDGLFGLGRVKLLVSILLVLDFPFSWGLFHDLFEGAGFFMNFMGLG